MNSSYIVKMLAEISTIMNENKDRLIELDSDSRRWRPWTYND